MLQYQPHDDDTVSDAEMEEIVRRLHSVETKTSTADVAEALGVPQDLVRRMLADIRSGSAKASSTAVSPTKRFNKRRILTWSLSGIAALALLGSGVAWFENRTSAPPPAELKSAPMAIGDRAANAPPSNLNDKPVSDQPAPTAR